MTATLARYFDFRFYNNQMTFTNLSFETGDGTPTPPAGGGTVATGWSVAYVSTGSAYANFGDASVTEAAERFERNWSTNEAFLFGLTDGVTLSVATFNPAGPYASTTESFEALWSSNEAFLTDLGRQEQLNFSTTLLEAEGFEREWSSDESFKFFFLDTDLMPSPAGAETFETTWRDNQHFVTSFAPSQLAKMAFDGTSPTFFEDFEQVDFALWDVIFSVVTGAGVYTITVENAVAEYLAAGTESPLTIRDRFVTLVNNLGQHYIAQPSSSNQILRLLLDERIVNNPALQLADLLDGGGAVKVSSPTGPQLTLERVDATTLWTQSGKLFSI